MYRLGLLGLIGCGFQGPPFMIGSTDAGTVVDGRAHDAPSSTDDAARDASAAIDAVVHDAFVMPDANPWPCGPEPAMPPTSLMFGNSTTNMTASGISLDGTRRLIVKPSQALQLDFTYAIHDAACSACIDQIEYGFVQGTSGHRIDCAYDGTMQNQMASGTVPTQQFNAPSAPGQYDLRIALAENFSCNHNNATDWYGGNPPPAMQKIAVICVH